MGWQRLLTPRPKGRSSMNVLITGGTGFIGRRLVAAALRRGWTVSVLVRRPDSPQARAAWPTRGPA